MARLIGISGSLRRASFNTALLRTAAAMMPAGTTLELRTLHGIPLFDADVQAEQGMPEPVITLKDAIAASDGVILATPEYNASIPGVFKNAIDWLSRPPADIARVFGARRVALMGATPGGFGTVNAQTAWLPVLRALGTHVWNGRLLVSRAGSVFDEHGAVIDEAVQRQLREFVAGFVAFTADRP